MGKFDREAQSDPDGCDLTKSVQSGQESGPVRSGPSSWEKRERADGQQHEERTPVESDALASSFLSGGLPGVGR